MRMEHSENFKAVLEEKTREAESIIAAYLPKEEGFAKELAKAMNYSMTAGGKRLRPLLLQESFRLFGGTGEAVKPFMANTVFAYWLIKLCIGCTSHNIWA